MLEQKRRFRLQYIKQTFERNSERLHFHPTFSHALEELPGTFESQKNKFENLLSHKNQVMASQLVRVPTKKRIVVENACSKALEKFSDTNIFYRCAGARQLIELGNEGALSKGVIDEEMRQSISSCAVRYQEDTDPDIVRFSKEILRVMGAKLDKDGRYMQLHVEEGLRRNNQKVKPNIKDCLMDGQPVYRTRNPWRAALTRSLRENRTIPCKSMELISYRNNNTKINRVVKFRGFVLDGAAKDRLYTIVDSRIEKAEQIDPTIETEAVLLWRFKGTGEHYTITGKLKTIRDHVGLSTYMHDEPVKQFDAVLNEAEVKFRKIAWNICSDQERDMFQFPNRLDDQHDKHLKALMRRALQGLCINLDTFEARDPEEVFRAIDKDGSGMLDVEELMSALRVAHVVMDPSEVEMLFQSLDEDGSGNAARLAPMRAWGGGRGGEG